MFTLFDFSFSLRLLSSALLLGIAGGVQLTVTTIPIGSIVKYVKEDLNLTCRVNSTQDYKVTWSLPLKSSSQNARVSIFKHPNNGLTVTIHHLQEADTGKYTCEVNGNDIHLQRFVTVTVKSEKPRCPDSLFPCGRGICIPREYLCDGHRDCPLGLDENVTICGPDPCKGKIQCVDDDVVRCVSHDLCCDSSSDCTYLLPCCHTETVAKTTSATSSQGSATDMNFIQSTIYTIVSCAIAFIFITLIMIIAICRIHMKRNAMSLNNQPYLHTRGGRASIGGVSLSRRLFYWPWRQYRNNDRSQQSPSSQWSGVGEDDSAGDSLCHAPQPQQHQPHPQMPRPYPCTISSTGSFVVVYSGTNGVQLVERLPKPPPYSESNPANQDRGGVSSSTRGGVATNWDPPPVYASVENIGGDDEDEPITLENLRNVRVCRHHHHRNNRQ